MCGAIPKIGLIVKVVELFKHLQSHILEIKIKPLVEFSLFFLFLRIFLHRELKSDKMKTYLLLSAILLLITKRSFSLVMSRFTDK